MITAAQTDYYEMCVKASTVRYVTCQQLKKIRRVSSEENSNHEKPAQSVFEYRIVFLKSTHQSVDVGKIMRLPDLSSVKQSSMIYTQIEQQAEHTVAGAIHGWPLCKSQGENHVETIKYVKSRSTAMKGVIAVSKGRFNIHAGKARCQKGAIRCAICFTQYLALSTPFHYFFCCRHALAFSSIIS